MNYYLPNVKSTNNQRKIRIQFIINKVRYRCSPVWRDKQELAENDYNCNILCYADIAPPPEPQDVKSLFIGRNS